MRTLLQLLLALPIAAHADVRLVENDGRFELLRNGLPYEVKGAGGDLKSLASLAAAGGNSIRLWGVENLGEVLDKAQQSGLTVTAGIWLPQVRHGFGWTDVNALMKQREHVREVVLRYRNHPALLCWALGNEMEDWEGRNGAVWTAINSLAVMVRQLDPGHPTMTVITEIGGDKVQHIHTLCPEIDIIGINSYGGAATLAERYRKAGGTKPYMLTEFGPAGAWEIQKNAIGAYPELTSTRKAADYRRVYETAVLAQRGSCVGSYAFLWGHKDEVTSTWFSMLLPDGTRLAAVDTMQEIWTGKPPVNRCPQINSLFIEGSEKPVGPGATLHALLDASDAEGDPLKVEWALFRDPGKYSDKDGAPPSFAGAVVRADAKSADIKMPLEPGLYRLFAFVRDNHGGGATANVPLRVKEE